MNFIFCILFLASTAVLIFINPDAVMSSMLSGGQKALELSVKMTIIYTVWLGIFKLAEMAKLTEKAAKLLKPLNKFLFGDLPGQANEYASMNISANMLGMSGATTPMGIKTVMELEKFEGTEYAISMFFVINATSIQLIPTSVIALRSSLGSNSPADIILPTILATFLSSLIGVILVKVFLRKSVKKKCQHTLSPLS